MALAVTVEQFEGPLGLLLEYVEDGRLEVTSISVAAITSRYLATVKQLTGRSSEEVAEFVQLGARLLYIKSLALLPRASAAEQAEELHQLNLELKEYAAIQQAAAQLKDQQALSVWTHPATPLERPTPALPTLALTDLAKAFQAALERQTPRLPMSPQLPSPHLTLQTVTRTLLAHLAHGPLALNEVFARCRSRLEIILTFTASLELVRAGRARLRQEQAFQPITLEAVRA